MRLIQSMLNDMGQKSLFFRVPAWVADKAMKILDDRKKRENERDEIENRSKDQVDAIESGIKGAVGGAVNEITAKNRISHVDMAVKEILDILKIPKNSPYSIENRETLQEKNNDAVNEVNELPNVLRGKKNGGKKKKPFSKARKLVRSMVN